MGWLFGAGACAVVGVGLIWLEARCRRRREARDRGSVAALRWAAAEGALSGLVISAAALMAGFLMAAAGEWLL